MQVETNKLNNQMANLTDMLAKFVTANTASTSGSGTLPGNTVTNPRADLKGYTLPKAVLHNKDLQFQLPHSEANTRVVAPVPNTILQFSLQILRGVDNEQSRKQANEQTSKFYEIFKEMSFEISFTDALVLMPKFASTLRTLLGNKEKLTEVARTLQ
ncbi:hypothetical protein Tco_0584152 [Tanacetum coccineum]